MAKTCQKVLYFLSIIAIFLVFPSLAWAAASLSFSPASQAVTVNNAFDASVVLNTGGSDSDGVDAIVKYDGNKLEVVSATLGDLFANKLVADTSTAGQITFRATTPGETYYNGTGTFATINFKPIAEGTANVYFDFTAGSTTDSNVAYLGEDILGSVSNASYSVGQAAQASPAVGGNGTSTSSSVPASGTVEPTIILLAGGVLLILFGTTKLLLPLRNY